MTISTVMKMMMMPIVMMIARGMVMIAAFPHAGAPWTPTPRTQNLARTEGHVVSFNGVAEKEK